MGMIERRLFEPEPDIMALHRAIISGDLERVQLLIESGENLEREGKDNLTLLGLAAQIGHLEIVNMLLKAGANPNPNCDYPPYPPLIEAIQKGKKNLEVIKVLLEASAYIESINPNRYTPLMYAASWGKKKVCELLIEAGANVNARVYADTALMMAVAKGHINLVEMLIEKGADINVVDDDRYSILDIAYQNNCSKIVQLLENLGALSYFEMMKLDENNLPEDQQNYKQRLEQLHFDNFIKAVYLGDLETIQDELARGIDVNMPDSIGDIALCIAVTGDEPRVVRILIEAGADVNLANEVNGATPLLEVADDIAPAVQIGGAKREIELLEIMQILIEAGADVNLPDEDGDRPLMAAARAGSIEAVKLLLRTGAEVNAADSKGNTAVILARNAEHNEIVELLKEAGATE